MKSIHVLIIAIAGMLAAACTHNNGDIGHLFGKWKVTAIESDGAQAPEYAGNVFFNFQAHTVGVTEMLPDHETRDAYGTWSRNGDELLLIFPDAGLQPPAASLLPAQCTLQILYLDTGRATFQLRRDDGSTLTYTLKKW